MTATKKRKRASDAVLRYYDLADLVKILDVSVRTLHRWRTRGTFPASVRFGNGGPRWPVADIEKWRLNPRKD